MVNPRVIVVTGANRGIGRAICESILARPNVGPVKLVATSRKGDDLSLKTHNADQKVLYQKLDISQRDSIRAFSAEVDKHGPVSVLVNNAGVNLDQPASQYGPENAKKTLDINYRGTLEMCQTFLPKLSKTGRIVSLSSVASSINIYSPEIQQRLRSATTFEELEQLAQEFETSVRTSTEECSGFCSTQRSYNVSKALLRSATRILSKQAQTSSTSSSASSDILINCCCPGWIDTDMGGLISSRGTRPPKTPEEGARIPVRLALDDLQGVTGEHWANDSVRSREEGKVMQDWNM
ncbi:putative short-chain dehydrogenase/reductase SDR, NAD(P)-binding domain superfamily [Septoria linicola]|nr:putative short-chain dehydrogenase/reductase SDR, NAD(P)-binding domain superfamily [Septoria linicola]